MDEDEKMAAAINRAVEACIKARNIEKFLSLYWKFGIRATSDQYARLYLIMAEDEAEKLEVQFKRDGPSLSADDEVWIMVVLSEFCEREKNLERAAYVLKFALRIFDYPRNYRRDEDVTCGVEKILKVALLRGINCFKQIGERLGREFTQGEIDRIADIVAEKGDAQILISVIRYAGESNREKIINILAAKGQPTLLSDALKSIGCTITAGQMDLLAKGIEPVDSEYGKYA